MIDIANIISRIDRLIGQRSALESEMRNAMSQVTTSQVDLEEAQAAQVIIRTVAAETHSVLKLAIEETVTVAMNAVFDSNYEFEMKFEERRNQNECDLIFTHNGVSTRNIGYMDGGGVKNVAAFGLQMAVLSLMSKKCRPVLFLDEPMSALKGDYLPERGMLMIQALAKARGLTVLMVSHIPEQRAGADKVFEIKQIDGVSEVSAK